MKFQAALLAVSGSLTLAAAFPRVQPRDVANATSAATRYYNGTCTADKIIIHKEWRNMSASEKQAYLDAENCLINLPAQSGIDGATTRFSDLQALHRLYTNYTVDGEYVQDVIHNVGQFLPFHRYFLHIHESMMRNECNYTGPMTWWDEASDADAGDFFRSNMWGADAFGGNGRANDSCVVDGAFAGLMMHMGPGLEDTTYCLPRKFDVTGEVYDPLKYCSSAEIKKCTDYGDYLSFFNCVSAVPAVHNNGHGAVGGIMSDIRSSPGDPTFFMHHGFMDRLWWKWETANPSGMTDMSGNAWNTTYFAESGAVVPQGANANTTLDYVLHSENIMPDVEISKIMNIQGGYLCYDYDY